MLDLDKKDYNTKVAEVDDFYDKKKLKKDNKDNKDKKADLEINVVEVVALTSPTYKYN